MKRLFLIGGTMGIGKTTVSQCIKETLPNAVFLDGDWCWDASPFQVTDETKKMVMENICFLLNSFIHCPAYDNIVFCWVMHEQAIIDSILERLDRRDCSVKSVSLLASEESLTERMMSDVQKGLRTHQDIERSIARLPLYDSLNSQKVVTDGKSVRAIAEEIIME